MIDGVERILGVRTPDEVSLPAKNKPLSDFEADPPLPAETSQTVPDRSGVPPSTELPPPAEGQQNSPAAALTIDVRAQTKAQTQFKTWRKDVDEAYFDVLLSRYMNPQELEKSFPTAENRQTLKLKTAQMQKSVVSQVRKLVSDIKGATAAEKRALARELVTQNFDKDFADAVINELEKDEE